jgi:hypothetical protein
MDSFAPLHYPLHSIYDNDELLCLLCFRNKIKKLFAAGDAQGNPVLHPHPLLDGPLPDCGLTHQQLEDGQVVGQ